MKTIHLIMNCGLGDVFSHIARFPALREKFPNHKIKCYLGGYGRSPYLSKEQLDREGVESVVIKNFNYLSQIDGIVKLVKDNFAKEGDIVEDWSFCSEIFQNKPAIFWQYELQSPYEYTTNVETNFYTNWYDQKTNGKKNIIGLKVYTKEGNIEGFQTDVERGRFWDIEKWKKLIILLSENSCVPFFTGIKDENEELIKFCVDNNVFYINGMNKSVAESIEDLKKIDGFVSCNSFEWECTSRLFIPTYCFFLKNEFFIPNHLPNNNHDFYNTCYIETNREVSAETVFATLQHMLATKKRPDIPYSVAMVTYKDDDTIQKTMENIVSNIGDNELCVVHGTKEPNRTFSIVNKMLPKNGKLMVAPWEHDFSQQKNYALSLCKNKWKILLDADEYLDSYTWKMIPWLLARAEQERIDCYALSRINVLEGMSKEELQPFCQQQGWQLNGYFGNHINFPDFQRRIFGNEELKYVGKTHEQIIGFKKEQLLLHHPIHHHKTKERQLIGLEREHAQYKMKAEEVYEKIYG